MAASKSTRRRGKRVRAPRPGVARKPRRAPPAGRRTRFRVKTATAFEWYEQLLLNSGFSSSGWAARCAEQVFFLPEFDAATPISEGPTPADWKGYHAGKHGLYDRFLNLKGDSVSMAEAFYKQKYRWVNKDYLDSPNQLKKLTEVEFNELLQEAYKEAPRITKDLSGMFNSEEFTKDVGDLFKKHRGSTKATIWQGKLVMSDGKIGPLQTNVDFEFQGNRLRLAIDAKTGQGLNFFRIFPPEPGRTPMRFVEIVLKWKGKITDVEVHKAPNSTITVESSATWKGLLKQGMKGGAASGGVVAAFLGGISGFNKEGIPGALKGMCLGAIFGAGFGAATGGLIAVAQRFRPWLGRVAQVGGFVTLVASILLDPSDIARDPQEIAYAKTDDEGNTWSFRNIHKEGTYFPEYVPRGVNILCPDATWIQFGDERGDASSYARTPVTLLAGSKNVRWQRVRTPDGSDMWWWQDKATEEEHLLTFRNHAALEDFLKRASEENAYRFVVTHN